MTMLTFNLSITSIYILKWLLFWLSSMGGYLLILKPMGFNYIENFPITSSYFILCAAIGGHTFKLKTLLKPPHKSKIQLIQLILISLCFLAIPQIIESYFPLSQKMIEKVIQLEFYYPLFKIESSITKLADIIFQQTLILMMVLYLKDKLVENSKVIKKFTIIFFILHTPLIFIFSSTSLVFIIPSVLAGILFSYTILNYKYGVFYSFTIHMSFYIFVGVIYRIF